MNCFSSSFKPCCKSYVPHKLTLGWKYREKVSNGEDSWGLWLGICKVSYVSAEYRAADTMLSTSTTLRETTAYTLLQL